MDSVVLQPLRDRCCLAGILFQQPGACAFGNLPECRVPLLRRRLQGALDMEADSLVLVVAVGALYNAVDREGLKLSREPGDLYCLRGDDRLLAHAISVV